MQAIKHIRMRPNIAQHDLDRRLADFTEWKFKGKRVTITVKLVGREQTVCKDRALDIIKQFTTQPPHQRKGCVTVTV